MDASELDALKKQIRETAILLENKEGSRLVDLKEIPPLIRNLGFNPTVAQANMIIDQLASGTDSTLIPMETVEDVISAFLSTQVRESEARGMRLFRSSRSLLQSCMGHEHGRGSLDVMVMHWTVDNSCQRTCRFSCQNLERCPSAAQEELLVRDDYHTLIRAFRAFDPEGKGYCLAEQLKTVLQARGEPMTDDELNRMIGFAADEDGKLYYEDYCHRLAPDGRTI